MTTPTVRWLSRNDVAQTHLPFSSALDIVEATFRDHGNGAFENPPKIGIHPGHDAFIHAMAGWLPRQRRAGLKWVASYPSNYKVDLPNITGLLVLNDPDTGLPVCVMDAAYLTAVRAAAASAITSKYLSPRRVDRIAVIGAGLQGLYHVNMLSLIHPAAEFQIVDINENAVSRLAEQTCSKATVVHVKDAEAAIRTADLVVTATSRLEDVAFQFGWVKEGSLVLPVHVRGWSQDITTASDVLLTDDVEQFKNYIIATGSPYRDISRVLGSVSDVIAGRVAGRVLNADRVAVFNVGLAMHDVAIGSAILDIAAQHGLGTIISY
ncbi:ornithine cyclodeaminase family protein [Mesorhizobium sp. M1A.F.Ca.IN.020.03.2.1]|uniref:ornithine cyclodeaminase family protein n=1 Tax=unclassified Mesorhizobium TaxID=325217 RepID=UPI000FCB2A9A|nr:MULTISPECIES: ornithine cyclodeaminase family protein [unclassified Mesorhizobium]RUV08349.1 ornithine cyclodeaminase family protein [Mesorhizobium sp. M1A.F.Ca.IN.020.03.2.1]RUV25078.1 ornithine cyclodeaminase family protein [Mesorhizobium sp. M1A.F.Ca.IN.022.04.1.1]RWB32782.1 MAG: ornithine cyclodeaminase family protein [Mesorhizobium sp.]RWD10765.1 MAG: ornithine cyclodeaminase family protein [Mesorhizobium sp.]RWE66983.1 MAG: ornithine cyclodeaminase family protein [Mesorhizobium sp.]